MCQAFRSALPPTLKSLYIQFSSTLQSLDLDKETARPTTLSVNPISVSRETALNKYPF